MTTNNDNIRVHVLHTGRVCVSPGLPFKDTVKNPNPMQLTLLTSYGRRRVWLPVSAYLIEHPQGCILFDTGWGRDLSPDGCYDCIAQIRHMGFLHFLINQGVLPMGESVPEQLEKMGLHSSDLDYVILSHLHTDHASGLQGVREAKRILASEDEIEDTRKHGIRYAKGMWKGIQFTPFRFQQTGEGSVGESYDLFGDGSIKLIRMPGHTAGLAAMKSLAWIREMAMSPNCVEALANHDPDVIPHEIDEEDIAQIAVHALRLMQGGRGKRKHGAPKIVLRVLLFISIIFLVAILVADLVSAATNNTHLFLLFPVFLVICVLETRL